MSDDLTRKIEGIVIQIIAGMDEPEAAIAALIAEERARAFEEAAEEAQKWFDPLATWEHPLAAAIRALAKKETADGE